MLSTEFSQHQVCVLILFNVWVSCQTHNLNLHGKNHKVGEVSKCGSAFDLAVCIYFSNYFSAWTKEEIQFIQTGRMNGRCMFKASVFKSSG